MFVYHRYMAKLIKERAGFELCLEVSKSGFLVFVPSFIPHGAEGGG